jgi:hypothetical protein
MGGLLIDTLIYNHFVSNSYFMDKTYSGYFDLLKSLYEYLKGLNKDQVYWYAVGSNQLVYNSDNGSFIDKASSAYCELNDCDTDEKRYAALHELLGSDFPDSTTIQENYALIKNYFRHTEEFIENNYPIDIKFSLQIDCKVTQNGFRDFFLSQFLSGRKNYLSHSKGLNFFICSTNMPTPYSIIWKVRNVGSTAESKDCIRGQLIRSDKDTQNEHTNFFGPHFVECYLIKNGVCGARDRIDVPIGNI